MAKSTKDNRRDYKKPGKYLTTEETQQLRRFVKSEADRARLRRRGSTRALVDEMIIEIMLESRLRAEEICHLQLRDLPTHHGTDFVFVRKEKEPKVVPVKAELREKLQTFIKRCRKGAKPRSPLFASEQGYRLLRTRTEQSDKTIIKKKYTAQLSYQSLYIKIRRIGREAKIPNLHPNMFLYTIASEAERRRQIENFCI